MCVCVAVIFAYKSTNYVTILYSNWMTVGVPSQEGTK